MRLKQQRVPEFFLIVGLALGSVYLLPSGSPQITDLFLLTFVVSTFGLYVSSHKSVSLPIILKVHGLLVAWIFLHACLSSIYFSDAGFVIFSSFWVYNFIIAVFVFMLIQNFSFTADVVRLGVVISSFICVIGVVASLGEGRRATGFFNNPNQLSYYSLISLSIIFFIDRFRLRFDLKSILAYLSCIVSLLAGASLTAWAGALLLFVGLLVPMMKSMRLLARGGAIFGVVTLLLLNSFLASDSATRDNLFYRLDLLDRKIEGAESDRKVGRVFENSEYLLFGAGEALHGPRFGDGSEIHNAILNVVFNYGIIGLSLLLWIFFRATFMHGWVSFFSLMPIFAYNLTHMGMRSTLFWILIATIAATAKKTKSKKVEGAVKPLGSAEVH